MKKIDQYISWVLIVVGILFMIPFVLVLSNLVSYSDGSTAGWMNIIVMFIFFAGIILLLIGMFYRIILSRKSDGLGVKFFRIVGSIIVLLLIFLFFPRPELKMEALDELSRGKRFKKVKKTLNKEFKDYSDVYNLASSTID